MNSSSGIPASIRNVGSRWFPGVTGAVAVSLLEVEVASHDLYWKSSFPDPTATEHQSGVPSRQTYPTPPSRNFTCVISQDIVAMKI